MAWTAPKTWTSAVIGASEFNTHIRDNLLYLKGEADVIGWRKKNFTTTEASITNDSTEQTLFTYTLPGNSLGSGNMVKVTAWIYVLNNSGSTDAWAVKCKYGATTLATLNCSLTASASGCWGYVDFYLKGDGSTSAQEGWGHLRITRNVTTDLFDTDGGTATETSTGDLALAITSDFTAADANLTVTLKAALVELIQV